MRISDWSSDVCSSDLLIAVNSNPVDAVWPDRPAPSKAKLIVHPESYAGRGSTDKRREIADWLISKKADAVVLSALDSIAWTLNVRGQDVDRTPVALAYAIIHADATRSEEHTSELQSLMRISYAVFCLKKKNLTNN